MKMGRLLGSFYMSKEKIYVSSELEERLNLVLRKWNYYYLV